MGSKTKNNKNHTLFKNILKKNFEKKIWRRTVIISAIASFLLGLAYLFFKVYPDIMPDKFSQICTDIITAILFPIATSILSAAFLNIVYRSYSNKTIEKFQALLYENKSFIPNLLESYSSYSKIYRKNQNITVTFDKYENDLSNNFFELRFEIEYKTSFKKFPYLKFVFERLKDNLPDDYLSGQNEKILESQFYWAANEKDFDSIINNENYSLSHISIDNHRVDTDFIEYKNYESNDNYHSNIVEYSISTYDFCKKNNLDKNSFHKLRYTVHLPMQKNDTFAWTAEVPTFKNHFTIDYSRVNDEINCYAFAFAGPDNNCVKLLSSDEFVYKYEYTSCLLPKYGYVLSWWKK